MSKQGGKPTAFRLKDMRIMSDAVYRTRVFSGFSLTTTVCYAAFNCVMGVVLRSLWFGALAGYYLVLVMLRASVTFGYGRKMPKDINKAYAKQMKKLKVYRAAGIALLVVIVALTFPVAQMVLSKRAVDHVGLMIYVNATYTTVKVTLAIINFVKAKKGQDVSLEAIRNINLADAAVSVLGLQASLLKAFSETTQDYASLNALTGAAVCLFILILGVHMIVKSTKMIKRLKVAHE